MASVGSHHGTVDTAPYDKDLLYKASPTAQGQWVSAYEIERILFMNDNVNFEVSVLLNTIDSVRCFVDVASRYSFRMELIEDVYRVNAKSILGIFSLNLIEPMILCIHASRNDAEVCGFLLDIEKFIV